MQKPMQISENERIICKEALALIERGADPEQVMEEFPECREVIAKYLIIKQGEGE